VGRPAISVQGVGKTFSLHSRGPQSARQALGGLLRSSSRKPASKDPYAEGFWALRDVSLDIEPGEVVGVIGRNGAGKSVLLKLLSRVTRPTLGRIEIRGSVAPLLEVGTGFHPDLTGRENIYLNGVILGMRRADVHRRVDRIVAFAGVDQFLDTPIKRYSSGMRMRLAFAVAAHLERDVFLLDEVLTVGDKEYQDKCLVRLSELSAEGRTILLVTHGDHQMEQFCSRALLFDHGRLIESGPPADISLRYADLRKAAASAEAAD
jgi:lipopolysaccharide transport system ATP-binding protein